MGWKSTLDITADDARKEILARVFDCSSEALADALEALTPHSSSNYRVVEKYGVWGHGPEYDPSFGLGPPK